MIRSSDGLRRAVARMSWLGLGLLIGCGLPVGPAPSQSKTASGSGSGPVAGGSASSAARAPVRLSAGVALAQTLPSGTGMLFSVDYRFEQGGPDRDARYIWVIRPQNGSPLRQEVQLKDRGALQAFVEGLEPEAGPFSCRLEALARGSSQPVAVSEEVSMK